MTWRSSFDQKILQSVRNRYLLLTLKISSQFDQMSSKVFQKSPFFFFFLFGENFPKSVDPLKHSKSLIIWSNLTKIVSDTSFSMEI